LNIPGRRKSLTRCPLTSDMSKTNEHRKQRLGSPKIAARRGELGFLQTNPYALESLLLKGNPNKEKGRIIFAKEGNKGRLNRREKKHGSYLLNET